MSDGVNWIDLELLKRELGYQLDDLKQVVEDLKNDLRVEREARRDADAELREALATLRDGPH